MLMAILHAGSMERLADRSGRPHIYECDVHFPRLFRNTPGIIEQDHLVGLTD